MAYALVMGEQTNLNHGFATKHEKSLCTDYNRNVAGFFYK